jgi:hypothetical protein
MSFLLDPIINNALINNEFDAYLENKAKADGFVERET